MIGKLHHAGAGIADDGFRSRHVVDPVDCNAIERLGQDPDFAPRSSRLS
jgi:hypothetical protein